MLSGRNNKELVRQKITCGPGQGISVRNSPFKEVNPWEEKLKETIMAASTEKTEPRNKYPGVACNFMHKSWITFAQCPFKVTSPRGRQV